MGIGHQSNEVLQLLTTLPHCEVVSGNHDEAVLAIIGEQPYPKSHAAIRAHHEWIAERLDEAYIPFLQQLPREIEKIINTQRFLFTHYALRGKGIPFHEDPFASIHEPSLENMEKIFRDYPAYDCICFGHHHPKHFFQSNETLYINPGALGCNSKNKEKYAICTVDMGIHCDFIEVEYDVALFLADFKRTNIPEKEFILKAFYEQ
ncbi:metallophosphoesterase family protein [Metasolibacillus meyeri]|uniref:Metallophosphoesterase family protein n=1 Tax=Metasolibacillus meyeri TaxID=1071052 RepID=A0AAW9NQU0_9BACL|nr:metallophosphoesterase family protein [Metasolibacillus meyeri]MEC1177213.1 metallophosphoesterase family protein [Metasolibacillus meyeri]